MSFCIGDVVMLKSEIIKWSASAHSGMNYPAQWLTIEHVGLDGWVSVVWMNPKGELKREVLVEDVLAKKE